MARYYPVLKVPIKFFQKTTTLDSAGDPVEVLALEPIKRFCEVRMTAERVTDKDAPRVQQKPRLIIRAAKDLNSWKPNSYTVEFQGESWAIANWFPHPDLAGYQILILQK